MPSFLYFSFTPSYGLKCLEVFPAESASSLENRAKEYKKNLEFIKTVFSFLVKCL